MSENRSEVLLYRNIAIVAAVVAALLAGALIWAMLSLSSDDSASSRRSSALKAAQTYGAWMSSYNYADLTSATAPWTEIESHSTPSFRTSFIKTKSDLTSVVKQYKATATGTVTGAGVASVTGSRAVVLLFIDQRITNTVQKSGPTDQPLRVEVILARSHGKWLLDSVDTNF